MVKYAMADAIPEWLMRLKAGNYSVTEIEQLTGATRTNIYMRLESIGVDKIRIRQGAYWTNIYSWKGALHYLHRMYEDKKKIILKRASK